MIRNRKGQGTTEYIVIIAAVVIAFIAFWGPIKGALSGKAGDIVASIQRPG